MYTKLKNRKLWFDGISTIPPESIVDFLLSGVKIKDISVDVITPEIEQYNKLDNEKIEIKTNIDEFKNNWNIPDYFKTLDIYEFVMSLLNEELLRKKMINNSIMTDEGKKRYDRVINELELFKKNNLNDLLRCIIFVINRFIDNNIIWGIGRGSSVASYVLYLIKVHDIDSVYFNLDINEFIHE